MIGGPDLLRSSAFLLCGKSTALKASRKDKSNSLRIALFRFHFFISLRERASTYMYYILYAILDFFAEVLLVAKATENFPSIRE